MSKGHRQAGWIAALVSPILRTLGATWRIRIDGREHEEALRRERTPVLYAFWHCALLGAAYAYRGTGVGVMISRHRDGEKIARLADRLGFQCFRGSTTRGGSEALLEMLRTSPDVPLAITPDGPRGPAQTVQPGVVLLAQRSGRAILPGAMRVEPAWRLGSWDRFIVPKPFARIQIAFGPPLQIPAQLSKDERGPWAERVQRAILDAEARATELLPVRGADGGGTAERRGDVAGTRP